MLKSKKDLKKPMISPSGYAKPGPSPSNIIGSESNMKDFYIVEKILDKKVMDGMYKYKVKWLNYPLSQCTWEPKENLQNVSLMLKYFDENFDKLQKTEPSQQPMVSDSSESDEETLMLPAKTMNSAVKPLERTNVPMKSQSAIRPMIEERIEERVNNRVNDKVDEKQKRRKGVDERRRRQRNRNKLVLNYFNKIWKSIYELQKKYRFSSDEEESEYNEQDDEDIKSLIASSSEEDGSLEKKTQKKLDNKDINGPKLLATKCESKGLNKPGQGVVMKRPGPGRPPTKEKELIKLKEKEKEKEKEKDKEVIIYKPIKDPTPPPILSKESSNQPVKDPIVIKEANNLPVTIKENLKPATGGITKESNVIKDSNYLKDFVPAMQDSPPNLKESNRKETIKGDSSENDLEILGLPMKKFGDFGFGDKAKQILTATPGPGDEVLCLVEWLPRKDGTVPKKSKISNMVIKKFDPNLLVNFYESKLRFNQGKNNNKHNENEGKNINERSEEKNFNDEEEKFVEVSNKNEKIVQKTEKIIDKNEKIVEKNNEKIIEKNGGGERMEIEEVIKKPNEDDGGEKKKKVNLDSLIAEIEDKSRNLF